MSSLNSITPPSTRYAEFVDATANEPTPIQKAEATLQTTEAHFARAIRAWAAQSGPVAALSLEYVLRESLISEATLLSWQSELEAQGYLVSRAQGLFGVRVFEPPPNPGPL